jgi:3-isopropylmalate dehydrogenase
MISSACMMLDHLGENQLSTKISNAVAAVIEEGKARTYDMMKMQGRQDVLEKGAASTHKMTDAIIDKL